MFLQILFHTWTSAKWKYIQVKIVFRDKRIDLWSNSIYIFSEKGSINYNSGGQTLEDQLQVILEVRKQIEQELTKVIDFEEKLAQISPQRLEMLRPDMLTPYTIDQLSDEFPFLNWREFFDSALQNTDDDGRYT